MYQDLIRVVWEEILDSHDIMELWEIIACNIPPIFELYSLDLLTIITNLWVNIRGYSFTKGWNSNFEGKFKKGTRKSLNPDKKN